MSGPRRWAVSNDYKGPSPVVVEMINNREQQVAAVEEWPDAYLIAAAPRLLEAMKAVIAAWEAAGGVLDGPVCGDMLVAMVEARTAIAAAPEGVEVTP